MSALRHPGQGGEYVQEVARNEAIFPLKDTPKGVRLEMPKHVYLYEDDSVPGGVRLVMHGAGGEVYRDGLSLFDVQAVLALAVQRGVERLGRHE
jgi:hypothetical protein